MALAQKMSEACPLYASFFGYAGAGSALFLSAFGASYGTAKAASGIIGGGMQKPNIIMKGLLPVIMAGMLTIYGFVVSLVIFYGISKTKYSLVASAYHLAAGLSVGLCCIASGYAIGIIGDCFVRGYSHQDRLFTPMLVILIFSEILGLFGAVIGLALVSSVSTFSEKCP